MNSFYEREWITLEEKINVGYIENSEFFTFRRPEHFFRKTQSFGISAKVLNELINKGIQKINFIYEGKTENAIFTTTISKILEMGLTEQDYTFGFLDKQYFIPLKEMKKELIKDFRGIA